MTLLSRRILLATDGSGEAELAARAAVELANNTGSELHLKHVKPIPLAPSYPEGLDWREDLERAEREARGLLDERVKMVEEAGGTVTGAQEEPVEEIVALAEDLGVRLIIVGRRNRGLIRRALAGSVSDSVVRHAHRPVLVVPSHKAADNRARLSRGTWTARSGAFKQASARRRDREQHDFKPAG